MATREVPLVAVGSIRVYHQFTLAFIHCPQWHWYEIPDYF